MIAEDPEIARARGRVARWLGDGHRRHGAPGATFLTVPLRHEGQQLVQLSIREADQRQIVVVGQQVLQLGRQQRLVPGAEFRQLVVRDAIGPALRLGQMPEHDHRRFGQPQLRGGQHAPVARDQLAVLTDEAGHRPAELGHAGGDLRDLVGAMHLRVLRVGLEARQRPRLDPLGGEVEGHAGSCRWSVGIGRVDSGIRGVSTPRGRPGV